MTQRYSISICQSWWWNHRHMQPSTGICEGCKLPATIHEISPLRHCTVTQRKMLQLSYYVIPSSILMAFKEWRVLPTGTHVFQSVLRPKSCSSETFQKHGNKGQCCTAWTAREGATWHCAALKAILHKHICEAMLMHSTIKWSCVYGATLPDRKSVV